MPSRTLFAGVALILVVSACGGSTSAAKRPVTPGTVGSPATASDAARAAALVKTAKRDFAKGRTDLAKRELEAAVKRDPNNKDGWYSLGVIAQNANDVSRATTYYEHAVTIDPHFESALYNYGILLFSEHDLDLAIDYLAGAVQENDKDANAHWNLGLALAKRNNGTDDKKRSAAELNRALELNPRLAGGAAVSTSTVAP